MLRKHKWNEQKAFHSIQSETDLQRIMAKNEFLDSTLSALLPSIWNEIKPRPKNARLIKNEMEWNGKAHPDLPHANGKTRLLVERVEFWYEPEFR